MLVNSVLFILLENYPNRVFERIKATCIWSVRLTPLEPTLTREDAGRPKTGGCEAGYP